MYNVHFWNKMHFYVGVNAKDKYPIFGNAEYKYIHLSNQITCKEFYVYVFMNRDKSLRHNITEMCYIKNTNSFNLE